jgi:UDP-N-acetyl-D-mannosaminuronate dehydrogenase
MGYLDFPLAPLFSEQRFSITGLDIDSSKVATLNRDDSHIVRISGAEI